MGRKYKNPPIIETLCEFRFGSDTNWDFTFPWILYGKLKKLFPKPVQEFFINATGEEKLLLQPEIRAKLKSEDEKTLIQIEPDLFSVNHLNPYTSWNQFKPLIEKAAQEYCSIIKPKEIERISLRYINRIEIPKETIELEDYFRIYPSVSKELSHNFNSFIVGVQIPYENLRDILKIELAQATSKTNSVALMLDLQYFLTKAQEFQINNVVDWIETAHNHIEESFEACISDNLRQIFEEVKE